jgi:hypothetical protein
MSYAGPISRGARVPDTESSRTGTASTVAVRSRTSPSRVTADTAPAAVIFAAGVAVGIAVGAAGALLLAPQTGADTRRAIARRGRRLGLRGRDAWEDLGDELRRFARRRRRAWQRRRDLAHEN